MVYFSQYATRAFGLSRLVVCAVLVVLQVVYSSRF